MSTSQRTRLRWWQVALRVMLVIMTPCVFIYRARHPATHQPVGAGGPEVRRARAGRTAPPVLPPPDSAPLPAWARGTEAFASSIFLSGGRHFETQTFERRLSHKNFVVTADYPQLAGDDGFAAQQFNQAVRALVNTDLQPYLEDKRDRAQERDPLWRDAEEYHHVTHKVVFASDELISVLFYADGYAWGAAHGYHYPLVLNYDLRRGRALRLADLFDRDADYLSQLARYCLEDLAAQFGHDTMLIDEWRRGAAPQANNYRSWVLTPLGLVIVFKEYQVGPYAAGEPKVFLPYARLRDIIDPGGPVGYSAALD